MNETKNDNIAARFRKTRIDLDMNQQELAKILKVSQSVISDIERGSREPSRQILVYLAEKYNVDLNWLLLGKSTENADNTDKEIERLETQIQTMDKKIKDLEIENKNLTNELLNRMRDIFRLQKAENGAAH